MASSSFLLSTVFLLVHVMAVTAAAHSAQSSTCPCFDYKLCEHLRTGPRPELVAFSVSDQFYDMYDWSALTTIALFNGMPNNTLICKAHENDVRVVWGAAMDVSQLANATARTEWVNQQLELVMSTFTDGINIDIEEPIDGPSSDEYEGLSLLVQEAATTFHTKLPGSQVTFDVAWSPNCIDGRCYNYSALNEWADYLIVMDYDVQSQIKSGPCVAKANAPIASVIEGIVNFTSLGIPMSNMVMALPWYGFDYSCTSVEDGLCYIPYAPFRGVKCSDAAGTYYNYTGMLDLAASVGALPYDDFSVSGATFNYTDESGVFHVAWYDDYNTISQKCGFASDSKMRGAAVWTADYLPYKGSSSYSFDMWEALASCLSPSSSTTFAN